MSNYNLKEEGVKISHGVVDLNGYWGSGAHTIHYRNSKKPLKIPQRFIDYIKHKTVRWITDKYSRCPVEFTIGTDGVYKAIALVHPKDNFCRKIGRNIVVGRIKRARGDFPRRKPYKDKSWVIKIKPDEQEKSEFYQTYYCFI